MLGDRRKSAFYFVPMTYPAEPLNGIMVSGLGTPGLQSDFAYPPEFKSEILTRFRREVILEPAAIEADIERYLQLLWDSIEEQASIVVESTPSDTDLTVLVFGQTDRTQHFLWHEMERWKQGEKNDWGDAVLRTYQKVDAQIGRLLEMADPEATVVLLSDHGMGPYDREFYLNNWLCQNGFLTYKSGGRSLTSQLVTGMIDLTRQYTRGHLRDLLRLIGRQDWIKWLNASVRNPAASFIDWSQTKAYSFGHLGNICLNLRGREPEGTIDPGTEAQAVLDELERRLLSLVDPDSGENVVERVYRREHLYSGKAVSDAPDLVLVCQDEYFGVGDTHRPHDAVFTSRRSIKGSAFPYTARHRLHGILAARGPFIREGATVEGASILDLAPTLLYFLGLPIATDLDGRILKGIVQRDYWEVNPPRYASRSTEESRRGKEAGYRREDESRVEERLRSLGYLE
jgi:predicted AlkP superfamily phosphohydrolase/phosphomutase